MFFLIDCNNFYVSCERVFNPKLNDKAIVVLSNNDVCVISRSNEAKKLDIPMGAPIYLYKQWINEKKIFALSSNFSLYGDISNRLWQLLALEFPYKTEIYSIDEVFIHLEIENDDELLSISKNIRKRLIQCIGIPTSIGIAPTKTLAKIAASKAKRLSNGIYLLTHDDKIDKHLKETSIKDVWGIGRKLSKKMHAKNIYSAFDFSSCDNTFITKHFTISGLKTALELRKKPCITDNNIDENKKSIISSRSFSKPISSKTLLDEAISAFTAIASKKLQKKHSLCSYLSVFIATNPFLENYYSNIFGFELPIATSYTADLITFAKEALNKIYKPFFQYKKLGVCLTHLSKETIFQQDLFQKNTSHQKQKKIMETINKINHSNNKRSIYFAAEGIKLTWQSPPSMRSNRYTTNWDELLTIDLK